MTTEPNDPLSRYASDLLCLWALCGKPACRRARACKRDPKSCARRFGPLAPEEARIGALALVQGAIDGVDRDEVRRFEPSGIAALEAWTARIAGAADGQAADAGEQAPAGA
jgi:hypothetical protein